jgi:O-antigen/teichoic acid export membrane protein
MESLTKKIFIKQNFLSIIGQFVSFISNMTFNLILPIFLGSLVFGVISLLLSFGYFISGILDFSFNYTAIKYISKYFSSGKVKELRDTAIYLLKLKVFLYVIFSLFLFLSSDIISSFYKIENFSFYIKIVSLLIPFYGAITLFNHIFIAIKKNEYLIISCIVNGVFLIILPLTVVFLNLGIEWLLISVLITFIINLLSCFRLLRKYKLFAKTKKSVSRNEINEHIKNFSFLSLSSIFMLYGITILLGSFSTPKDVAFFKIALNWVTAATSVIPISSLVIFSSFVELRHNKRILELKNYLTKTIKYGMIILMPLVFGLFIFAEDAIKIVYGTEFLNSIIPLKIISWSLFAIFLNGIFFSILIAYDEIKKVSISYLIGTLISFVLSLFLISTLTLEGSALSYLITNYVIFLFLFKNVRKIIKIDMLNYAKKPLISVLITSAIIIFVKYFSSNSLYNILSVILYFVFYTIILVVIKGLTKNDFRLIKFLYKK